MATLYPAQGEPQHIETPAGGFTTLTISNLITGDPFYTYHGTRIIAMCIGAYSLHMPENRHEDLFQMPAHGDVLVMSPEELAQDAHDDQERWNPFGSSPGQRPELTQMMQRYEQLYHETEDNNDDTLFDKEKVTERVDLYYKLRQQHGIHLDTRTNPWSWVTITPEEEEEED